MKVLHVTHTMDPKMGGVAQAILNIVKGLNELGAKNEVISLDAPGSIQPGGEFNFHAVGPGKTPWQRSQNLNVWLNGQLDSFDAVIVHGLWLYYGYAVRKQWELHKLTKSKVPKLFVMPHGMLDPYFQKAEGRKLKAIRNTIYWTLIEKRLIARADALLFTCEEEKILARKTFKDYQPKKELVVSLGVDNPPVLNRQMEQAFFSKCPGVAGKPYLLFLSRIHPKKGIDNLINAYASLTATESTYLIIAGPGLETPYGAEMLKLAKDNGSLNKTIFFCGMLTGDAKWGAFYGCDAFILPSHQENFGIAVVEALACGKPVLISDQINIWREIKNAGAGIVAEDTADGTKEILNNFFSAAAEDKKQFGNAAISAFTKNFSISTASQKLYAALSEIILT